MRKEFASHMRQVYLMLTEFCPNRCVYCYIKNRHIHEQMAMADIDTLLSKMEYETPRIIFFGGEPLMEIDMMQEIIKKYPHCTYQVITSGTVNYDRFLEEVAPKMQEIQLSWDGPDNLNRPSLAGDTQDKAYERIIKTIEHGYKLDVRCVLNEDNIKNMTNTYDKFYELYKEYPDQIHGDFVVAHQENLPAEFSGALQQELFKCLTAIQQDLKDGLRPYIPRDWVNKLVSIQEGNPKSSCDAGSYIVMRPNGDLYGCTIFSQLDAQEFKIGNVNEKGLDLEVIDMMKEPCSKESCQHCTARMLCDGGCRYERQVNFKDEWQKEICPHQCSNSLVFYTTMQSWLNSLDGLEKWRLDKHLDEYRRWMKKYAKPRC